MCLKFALINKPNINIVIIEFVYLMLVIEMNFSSLEEEWSQKDAEGRFFYFQAVSFSLSFLNAEA